MTHRSAVPQDPELQVDPAVAAVVTSWRSTWDDRRSRDLGLPADPDIDSIVAAHIRAAGQTSR